MTSGFLLINKPENWTSHDVVAYLRKVTGIKTIGHAGTLDPFATGLLIVGVGREATKRLDEFKGMPKTYVATMRLGATSDTYDRTGHIVEQLTINNKRFLMQDVSAILRRFIGKQQQIPPMYSAKKIQGKKLYELARKGIEVERRPQDIEIYALRLCTYKYPLLQIEVVCSPGTYIRTLCHDIGKILGSGAYCEILERTAIGIYTIADARLIHSFST